MARGATVNWALQNKEAFKGDQMSLQMRRRSIGRSSEGYREDLEELLHSSMYLFKEGEPHYRLEERIEDRAKFWSLIDAIKFAAFIDGNRSRQSMMTFLGISEKDYFTLEMSCASQTQKDRESVVASRRQRDLEVATAWKMSSQERDEKAQREKAEKALSDDITAIVSGGSW
jgi:hypothetical protein